MKIFNSLLAAISFYTRLPIGGNRIYNDTEMRRSIIFLPLVGVLVGGIGAFVWFGASFLFFNWTSLILSLASTLLVTGAFHEDGLADTCDGLGGGWTKEDKLKIMKDSRIGSYGLLGVLLVLLLKLSLLGEIESGFMIPVMIITHTISRLVPVSLVRFLNYIRSEDSKSGAASSGLGTGEWLAAHLLALAVIIPIRHRLTLLFLLLPIPVLFFRIFYKKQVGGYTGDLLGASQQISELFFLMASVVLCRFIV